MGLQKDRVKLNVGGRIFETTSTTLANAGRNSLFGAMFDDNWDLHFSSSPAAADHHFLDRNPDCFSILLDLLRTGELHIPPTVPEKLLYREASFYGLLDHVRAAKWGPFDGNRLHLTRSTPGRAPGDGTAIRAGPDGGCCVAHGSMVHVYDWTLEEQPTLNLNYQRVNDVLWVDSDNIAVAACERIGRDDGGLGLFSSSSGELRHKFSLTHQNQPKSFTGGALALNPDYKLFSSCKGRSNEYGVATWDQMTGQQIDFFYEPPGWSLGEADKLQWLNDSSCLLVSTLFPRKDNCYISLLDFRDKSIAWSWCDFGAGGDDDRRVRDAVAMEEMGSICVVNDFEDLGFLDLRRLNGGGSVRWSSRSRLVMKGKVPDEPCCPKLAYHDGQLFSSMDDSVSVFCGPDWVLTSRLRNGCGGSICDFSIGGDRLFALHSEENVFDVWETRPVPIL